MTARVHGEIETYARELGWVLDQVCAALDGLTAAQLTWRPATEASNSLAAVRGLAREITAALAALSPAELDRRFVPPQALWGTGPPHEISRRDALVESIRHAALHLGELRLTRDLAVRSARAPRGP